MTAQPRSAATTAKLLVVVMGFAWGFNWIATRIILSALPPWTMRTLGIGLGALTLFWPQSSPASAWRCRAASASRS